MLGIEEWGPILGLLALLFGGLTKVRSWLFGWLGQIELGTQQRNSRLRLVVSVLFFGCISVLGLFLSIFLLVGVTFNEMQNYLITELNLEKIEITDVSKLKKAGPYLGTVLPSTGTGRAAEFSVVHFQDRVIDPLKSGIMSFVALISFVLLLLIGLLGLIAYILNTSVSPQENNGK
jgi:hypothetical protein